MSPGERLLFGMGACLLMAVTSAAEGVDPYIELFCASVFGVYWLFRAAGETET